MQTFLYVLGPFILQCAGALAVFAVGVAVAHAVVKRTVVAVQLKQSQRDGIEQLRSWAHDADCFVDDLVVQTSLHPSLKDALPEDLQTRLFDLNADSPQKQLDGAKPRRAITGR